MALLPVACGFVVGLLVGSSGVGAGAAMAPALVLLLGLQPETAVGTDLLFASTTKGAGVLVHGFERRVNWGVVGLMSAGSWPACFAALFWLNRVQLRDGSASAPLASTAVGVALLAAAVAVLLKEKIAACAGRRSEAPAALRRILTVAAGAILGALVAISSVGAGAIGAAVLIFLYPRLSAREVIGSDLAHAAPLALVAGLGHMVLGSVNWGVLGWLLMGSLPGVFIGSMGAARIPEVILRPALAVLLIAAGCRLVFF